MGQAAATGEREEKLAVKGGVVAEMITIGAPKCRNVAGTCDGGVCRRRQAARTTHAEGHLTTNACEGMRPHEGRRGEEALEVEWRRRVRQ